VASDAVGSIARDHPHLHRDDNRDARRKRHDMTDVANTEGSDAQIDAALAQAKLIVLNAIGNRQPHEVLVLAQAYSALRGDAKR
jgi:hypothetical protein